LSLPIVKGNELFAFNTKKDTAENLLDAETNVESIEFLHVFVDFDLIFVLSFDGENVLRRVGCGPH
jgi:hypothetical protein